MGNDHATSDVMTQQWNKYAHLTNNAKCNLSLNMKNGYATTWDAYISLQMPMQPFLYEILITIQLRKSNASTIFMQMHFCIFIMNDMENAIKRLYNSQTMHQVLDTSSARHWDKNF